MGVGAKFFDAYPNPSLGGGWGVGARTDRGLKGYIRASIQEIKENLNYELIDKISIYE